jgi:hypothetical protein
VLAVGQVAKAEVPVAEADQALALQARVQLLADLAVDHRVGFLGVVEQVGEVEHGEFRHLGGEDAGVEHGQVEGAALQRGDGLQVAP